MLTVKKTAPGVVFRSENPVALQCLMEWARGGETPDNKAVLSRLLRNLYDNQLWLVCNCRPECHLLEAPALGVVKRGRTLFLRNLPSRVEHDSSCPLQYTRKAQGDGQIAQQEVAQLPRCLNLHTQGTAQIAAFNPESKGSSHRKVSVLSRLLFTLLDQAGALQSGPNYDLPQVFNGIRAAANQFDAWPGVSLDQVLSLSPRQIKKHCVQIKSRLDSGQKNAYGVLIGLFHGVESLDGKPALIREPSKQQPDGQVIRLEGKLDTIAARSISKGPFVGLVTVAPGQNNSFVTAQKGVIVPVAGTRYPIPVESDLERRVYLALQNYTEWLVGKGKPAFTIYKPMLDMNTELGNCRPDFIVRGSRGTAVIEVMGMIDDPEYRDRKARIHPIMGTLGTVIEIQPLSSNEDRAKEQLNEYKRTVRSIVA